MHMHEQSSAAFSQSFSLKEVGMARTWAVSGLWGQTLIDRIDMPVDT
jgi:hypothetical protein